MNYREKLEAIQSEVNELHPLLNIVLQKLPNVQNVEYTHGPNEKGADFVVARLDPTFGDTDYIGVIAKIGKVGQNQADIERQIEECEMERTFLGGKKKIFINEIWIISTGTISNNAQEKIHHKYKTRKITFIDAQRLSKWVDEHAPNFWTAVPIAIGEYLQNLRSRVDELDKAMSLVPLAEENFYIEQDIFTVEQSTYRRKLRPKSAQKADVFKMLDQNRVVLVEGGMGSGKSKLIRRISNHYSDPNTYVKAKTIPILADFVDYADGHKGSLEDLINKKLSKRAIEEIPIDGGVLVILDGADEVKLPPEQLRDLISSLVSQAQSLNNCKILITSRDLPLLGTDQQMQISGLTRLELRPLTLSRVIEFLKKLCSSPRISTRFFEDIKRSPLFKRIPKSPIAALLLAQLINENSKDLPSNITELYSKYMELVLGRWDMEKGLQSQKEYEALDKILMAVSRHMMEHQLSAMSTDEVKQVFRDYLKERNLGVDPDELFSILKNRCDIAAIDEERGGFRFKHRTFAEYFYAKSLIRTPGVGLTAKAFESYWMHSFFFFVGLLRDCPELVEQISNISDMTAAHRFVRAMHAGEFLLAAFASPYASVSKVLRETMLDAARLYRELCSGALDSPLSGLSRMRLLWLGLRYVEWAGARTRGRAHGTEPSEGHGTGALATAQAMNEKGARPTVPESRGCA